jgi:hypothetical protein
VGRGLGGILPEEFRRWNLISELGGTESRLQGPAIDARV